MTGTAAATEDADEEADSQKISKFEKLIDSITVTDSKAEVKDRPKSAEEAEIKISANGESVTLTSQKVVNQINEGIESGYWSVKESAGKLAVDLTEKGRSRFFKNDDDSLERESHCDGESGAEGDFLYLDDDATDSIQWGAVLSAGVFTIASAIVSVVSSLVLSPIVFAAAAVLATVSAAYIGITNEGCGIKIDTEDNSVSAQHCDC